MLRRFGTALAAVALLAATAPGVPSDAARSAAPAQKSDKHPAVIGTKVLGQSVDGRDLRAWHLGETGKPKVVLIATMHGDEPAPRQILASLRDGKTLGGINLWVVPVYNPDGLAAGTRKNAHGVDLNRNYPFQWADLDGSYESGPKPASEPETKAMMKFLRDFRPGWILSFHQPLYGVDTDTKRPAFARRVARAMDLPRKSFTCGGVCHGTMTGWYNANFRGTALTVEYGAHPKRRLMRVRAPAQVLSIWDAWRGEYAVGQGGRAPLSGR